MKKTNKNKRKKYAYGGTGYMTPDITYDIQKGNLDVFKEHYDLENNLSGYTKWANALGTIGNKLIGASGVPGADLLAKGGQLGLQGMNGMSGEEMLQGALMFGADYGLSKLQNMDFNRVSKKSSTNKQIPKSMQNTQPMNFNLPSQDINSYNTSMNNYLQNPYLTGKFSMGGLVDPPPTKVQPRYNYGIGETAIGRPIKIKQMMVDGNPVNYVFQDYGDIGNMPIGLEEMNNITKQLHNLNPNAGQFINADYTDQRNLYNNDTDYTEWYNAGRAYRTKTKNLQQGFQDLNESRHDSSTQNMNSHIQSADGQIKNSSGKTTEDGRLKIIQDRYKRKYGNVMATGGIVEQIPIEAEGQELIQTPDGQLREIQGPNHENGGVPMEVPQDSVIYSKRLKGADGQSMAKRKEFREKHLAKLEKLVKLNPNDKILKKTYEKTLRNFEKQEQDDVEYMNYMNEISNAQQQGLPEELPQEVVPMMATGGNIPPVYPKNFSDGYKTKKGYKKFTPQEQKILNDFSIFYGNTDMDSVDPNTKKVMWATFQRNIGMPDKIADGEVGSQTVKYMDTFMNNERKKPLTTNTIGAKTPPKPSLATNPILNRVPSPISYTNENDINKTINNKEKRGKIKKEKGLSENEETIFPYHLPTAGDLMSMWGIYKQGTDPLKLTQEQRAGDTPNINHYKDYGKKGLQRLEETKDFLRQQHNKNLADLITERDTAIARNRAGARGINTQRALDLATDVQNYKAQNNAYMNYLNQVNQVMGMEANALNQMDQMVMQGETARDLADRQDRDNYYTQLQRDTRYRNNMIQNLGQFLNNIKERQHTENMINTYSDKYIYKNGVIVGLKKDVEDPEFQYWKGATRGQQDAWNKMVSEKGYRFEDGVFYNDRGEEVDHLDKNFKVKVGGKKKNKTN